MAANNVPIFDRLVGLETEYAIRFRPSDGRAPRPSRFQLYRALIDALRRRVLLVEARHFKEGVFTANGGAVWFEAERPSGGGGLIEGATPECRGPRQLLVYQRAQDQLLAEAASSVAAGGQFCLIKNDRDSRDNVYGAQENYEATIAAGWRLLLWRAGLVLLLPLVLLTWLGFLFLILAMLAYLAAAGLVYLIGALLMKRPRTMALLLFGRDLAEGRETGGPAPPWLEWLMLWATRVVAVPLAAALFLLAWLSVFSRVRRQLLPFLISRSIIAGAGMLDSQGRFHLADKALAINCVTGYGGFFKDRPIFTLGHFFKAICVEACMSPRDYGDLFSARQRLQIGLGDSNMAETAEYLRIGATLLVLDVIEAGELPPAPQVRRPIRALHAICSDPSLTAEVAVAGRRRWTALQLQRFYLEACRRFLDRRPEAPAEARAVLHRWEDVLESLEAPEHPENPIPMLVGSLDWVTKKFLLDRAGNDASWAERKKIDIRYHELSGEGYVSLLEAAGTAITLVEPQEIERAIRTAPADSPATTRGHYIREFAQGQHKLSVNWKKVVIGQGLSAKVVWLAQHGRQRIAGADRQGLFK